MNVLKYLIYEHNCAKAYTNASQCLECKANRNVLKPHLRNSLYLYLPLFVLTMNMFHSISGNQPIPSTKSPTR